MTTRIGSATSIDLREGTNGSIACMSTGAPVPTIRWTFNNQPVRFNTTETMNDNLMLGSITSTLHLNDVRFPDDEGVYICIGSSATTFTTSEIIFNVRVTGITSKPRR